MPRLSPSTRRPRPAWGDAAPVCDPWLTAWAWVDGFWTSRGGVAAWQRQRAARLAELLRAARRAPLYRERLHAANGDDREPLATLQRMPPVHKRELMQRFDEWVTDAELTLPALQALVDDRGRIGEAYLGRYVVWHSSGSRGEPAVFVQDARALAVGDALEALRGPLAAQPGATAGAGALQALCANVGRVHRIAYVGAIDGHFAGTVAFERSRRLNPWLAATSRSFSFLQPIAQLVEQLNDYAPTVLASYPSMAFVLAQQQRAGRLQIAPSLVCTGGETLTPALRDCVAGCFHAPLRDSYGASECLFIASECPCGRLHLNADWVILEPVDAAGRPVPAGQVSHTALLTNLANRVQPIIRYDLGDRVRVAPEPCGCGSPLPVIEVHGRDDEVLTVLDARGQAVHLAPLALTTVLEDDGGVFDFRLQQRGPRRLALSLFGADAARHADQARSALQAFLRRQGLGATRVHCSCSKAPAARGPSGKGRRVLAA